MKIELEKDSIERILKDDFSRKFDISKNNIYVNMNGEKAEIKISYEHESEKEPIGFKK